MSSCNLFSNLSSKFKNFGNVTANGRLKFVIIYLDGDGVWSRHWHLNGDFDWNRLLYGNRDRLGLDYGVGLWHRNSYWNCVRDSNWNLKTTRNLDLIIY